MGTHRLYMNITGSEAMISGLETSTNYSVEVAAVNSAGVGEYSDPIIVPTESKICSGNYDVIIPLFLLQLQYL